MNTSFQCKGTATDGTRSNNETAGEYDELKTAYLGLDRPEREGFRQRGGEGKKGGRVGRNQMGERAIY